MSADNLQMQSKEEIEKQRRAERYGLTIKERRFINHYLRSGNAKESVRKAGYQVNDACIDAFASRLVRKVKVAQVKPSEYLPLKGQNPRSLQLKQRVVEMRAAGATQDARLNMT